MKKWRKIRTKKTFQFGKFYKVQVDEVETPGGQIVDYNVVKIHPFSVIIPIDQDGKIHMVVQHRYTTDTVSLELPMGNTEGKRTLLETAQIELEEETGLRSNLWKQAGSFEEANGIAELFGTIFIARDVFPATNPIKDDLDKDAFEIVKINISEVKKFIAEGKIVDTATISAFAIAIFKNRI